jgi:hypothetical protein
MFMGLADHVHHCLTDSQAAIRRPVSVYTKTRDL